MRCCGTSSSRRRAADALRPRLPGRPFGQFPPAQLQQARAEQDTFLVADLNGQDIVGRRALPDERSVHPEIGGGGGVEALQPEIIDCEPGGDETRLVKVTY